ncbi:MAG TPA: Rid family detoxifying hydrolase [Oculatellaceae cyanobacterium]
MAEKTKSGKQAIKITGEAPAPLGNYSHAIKAAGLLFVSGQGARDPRTGKERGVVLDSAGNVVEYDITEQTKAVLNNLTNVLQNAGCSLKDLVDVSVFLKDMSDFAEYNAVYSQYFNFENPPARTTVQVAGLPGNNFIEIKAIAVCPD